MSDYKKRLQEQRSHRALGQLVFLLGAVGGLVGGIVTGLIAYLIGFTLENNGRALVNLIFVGMLGSSLVTYTAFRRLLGYKGRRASLRSLKPSSSDDS